MALRFLSLLSTLFLGAHSHPAGLECGTDATNRLQEGKRIMNSVVAKAPADAPIKMEVDLSKVTITSKAGYFFAAKAFGDREKEAKVFVRGSTNLNMTKNCSNQVFVNVGMENSTSYTFHHFGATKIVLGYASAPGVVSLVTAEVPKPGPRPPQPHGSFCPDKFQAVYADMHDGDKKEVIISGSKMTIKPSGNNQTWVVNADLDRKTCSAVVDFNVPGKPSPPPIGLTLTLFRSTSSTGADKTEFEFTDPTGKLPAGPLNRWVELSKPKPAGRGHRCLPSYRAVYADMHDGDKKEVAIVRDREFVGVTIKPSGNNQTWEVRANLDIQSCTAVIDFNVPGKPGPPPVKLTATFWQESSITSHYPYDTGVEFTDPSGTLAAADFPLNRWVQISKGDAEILV